MKRAIGYVLLIPFLFIGLLGIGCEWLWYYIWPGKYLREAFYLAIDHTEKWFPKDPPNERSTSPDR